MAGEYEDTYTRAQRIKWWGHLDRMEKNKNSEEDYGLEFRRNEMQRMSKK
jgi:hypothetical protein